VVPRSITAHSFYLDIVGTEWLSSLEYYFCLVECCVNSKGGIGVLEKGKIDRLPELNPDFFGRPFHNLST